MTNAETGRAEYLDGAKLDRTCTMLRATCAIPLYFPAVQLSGGTFYDGGVADPIPIVRSLHDGNRKNLIVLTQPKSYRKALTRSSKFAAHALHRKYPAMTETMLARPGLYNDTVCLCRRLAEENPADTVLLQPDAPLATFEKDIKKLEWGYEMGYNMTCDRIDDIKALFV